MKEHLRTRHWKDAEHTCVNCNEPIQLDDMRWVHSEEEADEKCDDPHPGIA